MQIKISYLTFHQLKNQDGITDWEFSFWILDSCFRILVQLQHKVWVVKLSWSMRLGSLLNSSVVLIVVSLKSESIFFFFLKISIHNFDWSTSVLVKMYEQLLIGALFLKKMFFSL